MDAIGCVVGRIRIRRQAEAAPLAGHRQHAEAHAKFSRQDADHLGIAAVRVDDHQLAQARAMNRLPDLEPDTQQVLCRECDGSFRTQVLVRPMVWVGKNSTASSLGSRARTVSIMPCMIAVSVMTGRCGPCCSIAATGRIATTELRSSAANSLDFSSPQKRLCAIEPAQFAGRDMV